MTTTAHEFASGLMDNMNILFFFFFLFGKVAKAICKDIVEDFI